MERWTNEFILALISESTPVSILIDAKDYKAHLEKLWMETWWLTGDEWYIRIESNSAERDKWREEFTD